MKKLDIMRMKDGEEMWRNVNGKPTKVEVKEEEEVKEEKIKIIGPIIKEGIKEIEIKEKKDGNKDSKKKETK